jgi:hypothetical protein
MGRHLGNIVKRQLAGKPDTLRSLYDIWLEIEMSP